MTLTIELTPIREARLREKAALHGKDVADYLLDIADPEGAELPPIPLRPLSEYPSEAEYVAEAVKAAVAYGYDPVAVASLAQGIADGEAGREQTFESYILNEEATKYLGFNSPDEAIGKRLSFKFDVTVFCLEEKLSG